MSADDGAGENGRRPVRNMQGLLQLALTNSTSSGSSERQAGPMTEERRRFLQQALGQLSTDPVDALRAALQQLSASDASTERRRAALSALRQHAEQADFANDLEKLGALQPLRVALENEDAETRAAAAGVIADMVQNNPHCQRAAAQADLLPTLLGVVRSDRHSAPRLTALQAVSGLLRDFPPQQRRFCQLDGCGALLAAMQSEDVPRLQAKAAFLLASVCGEQSDSAVRAAALAAGLPEQLCALLQLPHAGWHEQLLAALCALVEDEGTAAVDECRRPELRLAEQLELRQQLLAGREEELETLQYCRRLRQVVFNSADEADR